MKNGWLECIGFGGFWRLVGGGKRSWRPKILDKNEIGAGEGVGER